MRGLRPLVEETDEDLMVAYQNGDQQAFLKLYQRYSGKVYGYLRSRLSNREAVDDLFQATYLKLHKARRQYNPVYPFAPWLFTICRTAMIDGLRKEAAKRDVPVDSFDGLEPAMDHTASAEGSEIPIDALTEAQRELIGLRFKKGLSFNEISEQLNISAQTARKRVSRIIRKLRERIIRSF